MSLSRETRAGAGVCGVRTSAVIVGMRMSAILRWRSLHSKSSQHITGQGPRLEAKPDRRHVHPFQKAANRPHKFWHFGALS